MLSIFTVQIVPVGSGVDIEKHLVACMINDSILEMIMACIQDL